MSKLSFFLTTLIAAVPAALLGYLCVAAFLGYSDKLPPILMGVVGLTLLACVVIVALPAAVLLKGRDSKKSADAEETPASDKSKAADEEESAAPHEEEEGDNFVEGEADEFEGFGDDEK